MRLLIVLLSLLVLTGCASGPRSELVRYLKHSNPFQADLGSLLDEMKTIPSLPVLDRHAATLKLADKVKARHEELNKLTVPEPAAKFHTMLQSMYDTLEQICRKTAESTGDPNDPELKKLSEQWKSQHEAIQQEATKLGAR